MAKWQIECGEHRGLVEAPTLGKAWRKLTQDKRDGFAVLARYIELSHKTGVWFYITPQALDRLK